MSVRTLLISEAPADSVLLSLPTCSRKQFFHCWLYPSRRLVSRERMIWTCHVMKVKAAYAPFLPALLSEKKSTLSSEQWERAVLERGVKHSLIRWWQDWLRSGDKRLNIWGFRDAQCLHCAKPKDRGLPERNVALLIRKAQQIASNYLELFILEELSIRQVHLDLNVAAKFGHFSHSVMQFISPLDDYNLLYRNALRLISGFLIQMKGKLSGRKKYLVERCWDYRNNCRIRCSIPCVKPKVHKNTV